MEELRPHTAAQTQTLTVKHCCARASKECAHPRLMQTPPLTSNPQGARLPSPRRNATSLHALPRGGHLLAARTVGNAASDRGETAPAKAGMHAHRQTLNTRGGDSVLGRPTDGSARMTLTQCPQRPSFQGQTTAATLCYDGELTSCSRCCIRHRRPWRNCAHESRHARTQADDVQGCRRRRPTCVAATA